jgi:hypothetical protein
MFSTVPRSVSVSKIFSGLVSFDRFLGVTLMPFSLLVIALMLSLIVRVKAFFRFKPGKEMEPRPLHESSTISTGLHC